ncbi:hypothetical protein X745_14040 [Mesorhizobium sp. LNJC374B00]|nr:hypothetical protein X771_17730 [Mesorhizobium sp. LSJC277A00]ESW83564.1 hypothetical protein X770_26345 [Mesorhizobium sp. LSJC269B00]ESX23555.1 hypothetical protein X767_15115 [Mesorhizobium sp. LSJC264A00]ESX56215.1 hypothetical protein X761_10975 [Mesorhizobium sp. LSHC424B00]ESX73061.1 hypothetical protein X758_10310 [Mesorhizobium sp. LSHC416B00]ESY44111.1 hypothetical protein X747_09235 [Mesorhizobium sp. LNJC384A00]ESY54344.1 hypothetical protein X745_14040 [Mesorhizobium sp. LNJC3
MAANVGSGSGRCGRTRTMRSMLVMLKLGLPHA